MFARAIFWWITFLMLITLGGGVYQLAECADRPLVSIVPNVVDKSRSSNATLSVLGLFTSGFNPIYGFLLRRGYNCARPPSIAAQDQRTSISPIYRNQVNFRITKLPPDIFQLCVFNRTNSSIGRYTSVATLTITESSPCAKGTTAVFGICRASPDFSTAVSRNVTIKLFGALPGARVFLLHPDYNCTTKWLPSYSSGLRTRVMRVDNFRQVTLSPRQLVAANYTICYLNVTTNAIPSSKQYTALNVSFAVGGAIDPSQSSVCCSGVMTAGQRAYCRITVQDFNGNPTGSRADECDFRVCPLLDGRGGAITDYEDPYYVAPGVFEFSFVPYGSGCQGVASVAYGGFPLGNRVTMFNVYPAAPIATKATSTCRVIPNRWSSQVINNTQCDITSYDQFNNPARRCSISTLAGSLYCVRVVE